MASFNSIITNAGLTLLSNAVNSGFPLVIDSAQAGDGVIDTGTQDPANMTALINTVQPVNIIIADSNYNTTTGQMEIIVHILNDLLTSQTFFREIGLFVGSTLFCYAWITSPDGDNTLSPPASGSLPDSSLEFRIFLIITNDQYNSIAVSYSISMNESAFLGTLVDLVGTPDDNKNWQGDTIFSIIKFISDWAANQDDAAIEQIGTIVQSLIQLLGTPTDSPVNPETVFAFLNNIVGIIFVPPIASTPQELILQQTIVQMLNSQSLDWAIQSASRGSIFGRVMWKAFNLSPDLFDPLTTVDDVVTNNEAVAAITANTAANDMAVASPFFQNKLNEGTAYMDNLTGTSTGIAYLVSNFSSMRYIVNSPAWRESFIRTASYSYNILTDTNWLNEFFTVLNSAELAPLFATPQWLAIGENNPAVWSRIIGVTITGGTELFGMFITTDNDVIAIINDTSRLPVVGTNQIASTALMASGTPAVVAATVASTNWMNVSRTTNTLMTGVLNSAQSSAYLQSMVADRPFVNFLLNNNAANGAQFGFRNSVAARSVFATSYIAVQEMTKYLAASNLADMLCSNNYTQLTATFAQTAYFTRTTRTLEIKNFDGTDRSPWSETALTQGAAVPFQIRTVHNGLGTEVHSIQVPISALWKNTAYVRADGALNQWRPVNVEVICQAYFYTGWVQFTRGVINNELQYYKYVSTM